MCFCVQSLQQKHVIVDFVRTSCIITAIHFCCEFCTYYNKTVFPMFYRKFVQNVKWKHVSVYKINHGNMFLHTKSTTFPLKILHTPLVLQQNHDFNVLDFVCALYTIMESRFFVFPIQWNHDSVAFDREEKRKGW